VGPFFERPPEPPDEIGEPEADEEPGGQVSARGLDAFQPGHGYPQGDPDEPEHDRAQDMAEPAEKGDEQGLGKGPAPGPADDDKRKIMVGTDDGVDETERRRRARQDPDILFDHRSLDPSLGKKIGGR